VRHKDARWGQAGHVAWRVGTGFFTVRIFAQLLYVEHNGVSIGILVLTQFKDAGPPEALPGLPGCLGWREKVLRVKLTWWLTGRLISQRGSVGYLVNSGSALRRGVDNQERKRSNWLKRGIDVLVDRLPSRIDFAEIRVHGGRNLNMIGDFQ